MRRPIRFGAAVLVCLTAAACATTAFELPPTLPEDFRLHVFANEAASPAVDYSFQFDRSGRVEYTILLRGEEPREIEGEFEVSEGEILSLYEAVMAVSFDRLATTYSASPPQHEAGVRTFYVRANDQERAVQVDRARPEQITYLQKAVFAVVPSWVLRGDGAPDAREAPMEIVVVRSTHLFHRPECEFAEAADAGDRVRYGSQFDALNYGFDPCPTCSPIGGR